VNDHFTLTNSPFAEVWATTCTTPLRAASASRNQFPGLDVHEKPAGAARSCDRTTVSASMFSEILAPLAHAQFDVLHTRRASEKLVFKYGRLVHGERSSCESRHSQAGSRNRMKRRNDTFSDLRHRHQGRRVMTFSCNGESAEYAESAVVVRVQNE